jgi:hypothetical protein
MKTLLATAQACANIAFIKFTLAKLALTNRKICFDGKYVLSSSLFSHTTVATQMASNRKGNTSF